jgi:hypothetical protein
LSPRMLVLGTSILWGQGLPEQEKIHRQVNKLLKDRQIFDSELDVIFLAHSGAIIGYKDNGSEDTTEQARIHGEVPTFYPTMVQQLKEFDATGVDPADVGLILIEGGINDVSLVRILNPMIPLKTLENEIDRHCYTHMKLYLQRVVAKFPTARIVVTAYYPFVTDHSANEFLDAFVSAAGVFPGKLDEQIIQTLGDLEKSRILLNCMLFSVRSQDRLQAAVDEVNSELGSDPRIALAVPNIQAENAAFTENPFLFGIGMDLKPEDPLAVEREQACDEVGTPRTIVPVCKCASVGHPNAKGAQSYALSIIAALEHKPTREFEYYYEAGSARSLTKQGIWFRDQDHRYVLFRGMNFAVRSKLPPYLPILPLDVTTLDEAAFQRELEAAQPHFDCFKELGINFIRLVIMWKGIEPRPNPNLDELLPEGQQYLDFVRRIVDSLYERGFFVLLDFHQDIVHELYGGDGFPDWALAIDEQHPRPKPSDLRPSPKWMLRYYDTPITTHDVLVRHTLSSFWKNDLRSTELTASDVVEANAHRVRTHLEKTIGATARYFLGHPAILGYEAFNEPQEAGLGMPDFEDLILPEYYGNVAREIRAVGDYDSFVFVEPRVDWTTFDPDKGEFQGLDMTNEPLSLLNVGRINDDRLVFSFHYYDGDTYLKGEPSVWPPNIARGVNMEDKARAWPNVFRLLREGATSRHLIPFLSEVGADQDWAKFKTDYRPEIYHHQQIRAYMDLLYQQIEAKLLNSAYWVYDLYSTEKYKDNWNDENASLLGPGRQPRNLDIIARVYPMRSSAEPHLQCFDLKTRHGIIILHGKPVDAPTVIYIPETMHYKDGFEIHATSADISWDAKNQLLYWRPDGDHREHQIVISPLNGFKQSILPADSLDLLSQTSFYWKSTRD